MKKIIKIFAFVLMFALLIGAKAYAAETKYGYVKYKDSSIYTQCYNYDAKEDTAIICIHGLGDNCSMAEFLSNENNRYNTNNPYMTIAYDNLGHGKSFVTDDSEINWENEIGVINAIIKAYNLKKVYLVGHSIGADIAMMYTKNYPQKVEKVVLLDRAYCNYSDLAKFNYTKDLGKTFGAVFQSDIRKDVYNKYIDMVFDNDITKTWNIDKKVLLIGSDVSNNGGQDLVDQVKQIKENPEKYNITAEEGAKLPDLSFENLVDMSNFMNSKIDEFASLNPKFSTIKTKFVHNMQADPESEGEVREYVLDFLKNK